MEPTAYGERLMVVAFWLALAVVAYVYVGYPVLLTVWTRSRPARSSAG